MRSQKIAKKVKVQFLVLLMQIAFLGSKIWELLPDSLKCLTDLKLFKFKIKFWRPSVKSKKDVLVEIAENTYMESA